MKAAYLFEQSVNINTAPDFYRDVAKAVFSATGSPVDWVIPKGTVVEGDEALLRVGTGQAAPIDEECAEACGMTPAQLKSTQRMYAAAMAGIRGKKDTELFMAGVIDGYDKGSTDDNPKYIPGKNWQAFQDAKAASEKEKSEI